MTQRRVARPLRCLAVALVTSSSQHNHLARGAADGSDADGTVLWAGVAVGGVIGEVAGERCATMKGEL